MEAGEPTGVRDDEHNLARLLHNALKEADACAGYALEAEVAGNEQLAGFFRDMQRTYTSVAGRAEEMLDSSGGEGRTPTGVRPGGVPAEGDPGDVSPGQDDTTPAEVPPRPTP